MPGRAMVALVSPMLYKHARTRRDTVHSEVAKAPTLPSCHGLDLGIKCPCATKGSSMVGSTSGGAGRALNKKSNWPSCDFQACFHRSITSYTIGYKEPPPGNGDYYSCGEALGDLGFKGCRA